MLTVDLRNQKFGVEIEMTGITRKQAAHVLSKLFDNARVGYSDSYQTYYTTDRQGRKWSFKYDSSIREEVPEDADDDGGEFRCEFVTPPLQYGDLETLTTAVRLLKKAGATVNDSCGMHVHVDASNHNRKSLRNLVILMATKQHMIYKAIDVWSNRYHYCKHLPSYLFEEFKGLDPNRDDVADAWYETLAPDDRRTNHYNESRYYGLNLHSVWYRGTVEWRCFNATVEADEVAANIILCLGMSAKAINAVNGFYFNVVDADQPQISKVWTNWLYEIGLKGDEFKTARKVLGRNMKETVRAAA